MLVERGVELASARACASCIGWRRYDGSWRIQARGVRRVTGGELSLNNPLETAYHAPSRPLRGALMRRHDVGRGAAPAGPARKPGTRAAPGLRPGPLQVPVRSWLKARPALSRGQAGLKRGLAPNKSAAEMSILALSAPIERMWRAGRRPPRSPRNADTIGLRCSARRPPSCSPEGSRITETDDACLARPTLHCPPRGSPVVRNVGRGAAVSPLGAEDTPRGGGMGQEAMAAAGGMMR